MATATTVTSFLQYPDQDNTAMGIPTHHLTFTYNQPMAMSDFTIKVMMAAIGVVAASDGNINAGSGFLTFSSYHTPKGARRRRPVVGTPRRRPGPPPDPDEVVLDHGPPPSHGTDEEAEEETSDEETSEEQLVETPDSELGVDPHIIMLRDMYYARYYSFGQSFTIYAIDDVREGTLHDWATTILYSFHAECGIDEDGDDEWCPHNHCRYHANTFQLSFDEDGLLHGYQDQAAVSHEFDYDEAEHYRDVKVWLNHGILHRDHGISFADGHFRCHSQHGRYHRLATEGPALYEVHQHNHDRIAYDNFNPEYWVEGVLIRTDLCVRPSYHH
jgi:hypothetical protein